MSTHTTKSSSSFKLFTIFFAFPVILTISYLSIEKLFYEQRTKKVAIKNAMQKSQEREEYINSFISSVDQSIRYIRFSKPFTSYLKSGDAADVEDFLFYYAENNPIIHKINYIDSSGTTLIEIKRNKSNVTPAITPKEQLSELTPDDFYDKAHSTVPNTVWYSHMHIKEKKEAWLQEPTISAVIKISQKGQQAGMLTIDYFIQDFISNLVFAPLYDLIVTDNAGYIIYHYDENKCWGSTQQERFHISQEFPETYREILSNSLYLTKNYLAKKLATPIDGGLNIIFQLNKSYITQQRIQARNQYITISLITLITSLVFSFLVIKIFKRTLLNLNAVNTLNEKLHNASEIAKIGFWEFDAATQTIEWSGDVFEIFEIEDKNTEITYDMFLSFIPSAEISALQKEFSDSITEQREYKCTHSVITEKKNVKYLQERAKHFYDSNGNFIRSLGSVYDITERYLSEERYKLLLSLASDGIFIMDSEGALLEYSDMVNELLGYTDEKIERLKVFDWDKNLTPDDYQALMSALDDNGVTLERTHTKKDGTEYIAQITAKKIFIQNSEYIYASVRDITNLKEYENKIISQKDELEAIFDTALEGISIVDKNGVLLKTNKKYCEIIGFSEEEIINTSLFKLSTVNKQYVSEAQSVINRVFEQGFYENYERDYTDPKGNRKRLRSSMVLMPNEKEILMTTVDNTDLYNAYKLIKQRADFDELTGLGNRKLYNEKNLEFFEQFRRYEIPFSMIMFDVDFFKSINDNYGHDVGDQVLKDLSSMVNNSVRLNDFVFRIGGEEFVILLTNTRKTQAVILAEKIRVTIQESLNTIEDKTITISLGVTEVQKDDTPDTLFKRADENLYTAKRSGRNKVEAD